MKDGDVGLGLGSSALVCNPSLRCGERACSGLPLVWGRVKLSFQGVLVGHGSRGAHVC